MSFNFDGRLFYADEPTAEKLRGPKPTVLVLGVAKSPTSADRRCRRVKIAVNGVSNCRILKCKTKAKVSLNRTDLYSIFYFVNKMSVDKFS